MAVIDRVADLVLPLVESLDLSVYDIEQAGPTVRVSVQSKVEGGIDGDALTQLTRMVSSALDEADLISGRYTLEISSPGLERKLRTVEHFDGAVGSLVKIKMMPAVEPRRREGMLSGVDAGAETITLVDTNNDKTVLAIDEISTARTVFEWNPAPKPGGKKNNKQTKEKSSSTKRASQPAELSSSADRSAP